MNMKPFINRHIITRNALDSGSITPMTAVMHRFAEPGNYFATVYQGGMVFATFSLLADRNAPLIPNTIDLGTISTQSCTVSTQTHTVFSAPRGAGGYSVVAERLDGDIRSVIFDSRLLGDGDLFVVVLLHPGRYSASNQHGAGCKISLSRATGGLARQISGMKRVALQSRNESRSIECTAKGFRPAEVSIGTAQPLTFFIQAPLRIRVVPEEPDDIPAGTPERPQQRDPTGAPDKTEKVREQKD
jgi:hypothetical protein